MISQDEIQEGQTKLNVILNGLQIQFTVKVSLSFHSNKIYDIINNYLKSQTQDVQFYKVNMLILKNYGVYLKEGTMQEIYGPLKLKREDHKKGLNVIAYIDVNPIFVN